MHMTRIQFTLLFFVGFAILSVLPNFVLALSTETISVSPPVVVVNHQEINTTTPPWSSAAAIVDGPLQTITNGSTRYWFNSNDINMAKFSGTLDKPFETPLWNKPTDQVFVGSQPIPSNPDGTVPGYWIVSTYQESAGILAFIHVEHPNLTRDVYDTGRTRIGLAWSADNGEHFAYLGDAIIPNTDPEAGFNIVGAPYLIKDGYFYIYFKDACGNAVARASVSDVITAAKKGKITPWMKYKSGSWNS